MEEAGLNCKVNPIESKDFPTKASRPVYSVLNKVKIKQDFQIEIPYWRDSLRKVVNEIAHTL
jgi:dTDP-4-dehydrorhamnose reductase